MKLAYPKQMPKKVPRRIVQLLFLFIVLWLGVDFYRFVAQFEPLGIQRGLNHPDGVEAFLPIGALTSLKYWLFSGTIHPLHPASLILFLAVILVSALFKKSFCGWICPVGFISELLYRPWFKYFRKNVQLPKLADSILRSVKYILLAFFLYVIGYAMSGEQAGSFLDGDYWKIADVKMLYFFTQMSTTSIIVIGSLILLSLPTRNFWCRFLCPYGALLGLVGFASFFKIKRNPALCHNCGACTRNCPAHLPVATSLKISSPECTSCLTCTLSCPTKALSYGTPRFTRFHLAGGIVLTFFLVIGIAQLTGHWKSTVSTTDLQRLVPEVQTLAHPR